MDFALVEARIVTKNFKRHVPSGRACVYYVLDNGKRYRRLYFDAARKLIGTRDSLGAVYTSDSIGTKQQALWRSLQRARRAKTWRWKNRQL